jgi:mRNA interferase RelE/StbE
MGYSIEYAPAALRQLKKLPSQFIKGILRKIEVLSEDPESGKVKKLTGTVNEYRLRVGNHRVIYVVDDSRSAIIVTKVAHRRDIYRNF